MTVQVLHEKCERNKADDKKLPSDSFLVTYKVEEELKYDVARGSGVVEIFDHYYDCLLYTSPSPRDPKTSRMPSSA